jgi:hypothetical protein
MTTSMDFLPRKTRFCSVLQRCRLGKFIIEVGTSAFDFVVGLADGRKRIPL